MGADGPRLRLDGQAMIAAYMRISVGQLKRIVNFTVSTEDRLPIFDIAPPGGKNTRWAIYVDELDAWLDKRPRMRRENRG